MSSILHSSLLIIYGVIVTISSEVYHPREGFFNGTSYLSIYSPIVLSRHVGLSFRTCKGGQLFSQSSQRLSPVYSLSLEVGVEGLVFTVHTQSKKYDTRIPVKLLDNEWHTVNILYRMGNLTISTSGHQQVIANSSFNSEILTQSEISSGNDVLLVGKGFIGCILQGPSIVFNSTQMKSSNVEWGSCPLPNHQCGEYVDHCLKEPCMRRGRCIHLPDRHLCQCTPRYSGINCQIDNGPFCERSPCKNNGQCFDEINGDYTCHCLPPFTGKNCELEIVPPTQICENNFPCQNNGTCLKGGVSGYSCSCKPGFEGKDCELNINECLSNPCQHGGTCIDGVNQFSCSCISTGYTGALCEVNINECENNPCLNNGICFDNYGGYTCQCAAGFGGQNCELKLNECASNPCNFPNSMCIESNLSYHCICRTGYAGVPPNCTRNDVCSNGNPCANGGMCISSTDGYECICQPPYTGKNCSLAMDWCDPCANGGTYMRSLSGFFCLCHSGFTGPHCAEPISCEASPCLNSADCLDYPGGYVCACKNGWIGDDCSGMTSDCNDQPCNNGGLCIRTLNHSYCSCLFPYTGPLCESTFDSCVSSPCQNGGTCLNIDSGFRCQCTSHFMGHNCELSFDPCAEHPCQNNGTCMSTSGVNAVRGYYCECADTGFEGTHCENNINDCLNEHCPDGKVCIDGVNSIKCQDPSEAKCVPNPCKNGGTCNEGSLNQTCFCPPGYKGEFCELSINECDTPGLCVHGICRNNEGSYQCFCTPGYTGDHCEIDVDECLSHPCFNGATCFNKLNSFECSCTPGFTGKDCRININECDSDPCLNGAECIDEIATFTCICPQGYTGRLCEENIDDCASSPCHNNGTCRDGLNTYSCDCSKTGYRGNHCEINIDECISNPCFNGAECIDEVKGYRCDCYPGYTGINCEIDIDECESNPCKNEGTCKQRSIESFYSQQQYRNISLPSHFSQQFHYSKAAGYECLCPPGVVGENCEKNINECESSPCGHGTCTDLINGYVCDCEDGYEGVTCQIEINECDRYTPCVHGKCVDRPASYICECDPNYGGKNCSVALTACNENQCLNNGTCIPHLVNETVHLFNCTCPHGFQGPTCEKITTMFFDGDSYGIVTTTREEGYDIRLRFKTTLPDGLLALGRGSTFYILELANGRLNLHSSLLNKWEGVFIGSGLNDSNWQQVFVTINSTHLVLAANQEQTIYPINLNEGANASHTSFGTTYLGGAMSYLRKLPHGPSTFRGCVQDVMINGQWVLLPVPANLTSISLKGVQVGCHREPQCSPNPCHSGGHCTDLWNNFSCSCERPYLGNTCQYNYTAATFGHENISDSVVTVTVDPQSRRAVRAIMDISMFIRTREPSGGIFYLGSKPETVPKSEETIIAAGLSDGELQVSIQFNGSLESYSVAGVQINTGYNQLIQVVRNVTLIQIKINGTEFFRKTITVTGQLDLQILQLGSTWPLRTETNFKGIIQDVQMSNGTRTMVVEFFPLPASKDFKPPLSLGQVGFNESLVKRGIVSDDNCRSQPCMHGGTCTVTWNDFNCECTVGYKGKECKEMEFCKMQECPLGSECRNLNYGYECVANITLHNPPQTAPGLKYRLVQGDSDLVLSEVTVSYRSRTGGNLLFVGPDQEGNYLSISVYQDLIFFDWNMGFGPNQQNISKETRDGDWTSIWLRIVENMMTGGIIGGSEEIPGYFNANFSQEAWYSLLTSSNISIGGLSDLLGLDKTKYGRDEMNGVNPLHSPATTDPSLSLFQGCIGEVRIGGLLLSYFTSEQLNNTSTSGRHRFDLLSGSSLGQQLGCVLCFQEECQNSGTCENASVSYACKCVQGFEGDDCSQNIDECRENDCKNNSTCIDGLATYTCECKPGWEGPLCDNDIDECASDPCQHNGTCKDELARFVCICPPEYVGDVCESVKQVTCESTPCHNGALCKDVFNPETNDNFTCSCREGFVGTYCKQAFCEVSACQNSGNCIVQKVPFCECSYGFTGKLCEVNIDECANAPCAHGGKCIDEIGQFVCDCAGTGYQGPLCAEDIDECLTGMAECGAYGTCQNTQGSFFCLCKSGWCGPSCNIPDPCITESPCANNGKCKPDCKDKPDYICECLLDFTGKNCTQIRSPEYASTNVADVALVVVPILGIILIAGVISLVIFVMMARKKRATRGTYSPSSQEFSNPRLELDNVIKPPPEERLI